ncbi:MAG: hypothetical protein ACOC1K_04620 [Nanoarchaeota archaeon]
MLTIHILIIIGFGASTFYIIKYLRKYYAERSIPKEWRYFWLAMLWATVHQLIEVFIVYQWLTGKVLIIFFILAQIIGGVYLIRGSYLLVKKYR